MINKRRNREIYPGVDNRFVICDVCGKKFRVKDTVRIDDGFNLLNNMIVCLADADQSNPQIKPIHIQEDLLVRKDYVRPEASFITYTNEGTTLPSAPRMLSASVEPFTNYIQLQWQGPNDYGNATVIGYRIYRGDAITQVMDVINLNTHSLASFYTDKTADLSQYYVYQVSIITSAGESPLSNMAFFPDRQPNLAYVVLDQNDFFVVLDQNNGNIILDQYV